MTEGGLIKEKVAVSLHIGVGENKVEGVTTGVISCCGVWKISLEVRRSRK